MAQRLYVRVTEINVERAKVRVIIGLNNVHKTFQPGANEGRKSPLWSFIIEWTFYQCTEN